MTIFMISNINIISTIFMISNINIIMTISMISNVYIIMTIFTISNININMTSFTISNVNIIMAVFLTMKLIFLLTLASSPATVPLLYKLLAQHLPQWKTVWGQVQRRNVPVRGCG